MIVCLACPDCLVRLYGFATGCIAIAVRGACVDCSNAFGNDEDQQQRSVHLNSWREGDERRFERFHLRGNGAGHVSGLRSAHMHTAFVHQQGGTSLPGLLVHIHVE